MSGHEGPVKGRELGYVPLALVGVGACTMFVGIGFVFLFGGFLIALAMVLADRDAGRRVSRPALAALILSIAVPCVLGALAG